ncbi:hypothetical protein P8C59_009140 [Phyllachora maydis]|uniref:Uncharacterized protein n=1 Tax=Phyllachora maydis TaxID=1825666 RepID=A0AAD9IC11_9PEZI|nr:hypothetical protein P8C59_009140 [Phyllachora maydis]
MEMRENSMQLRGHNKRGASQHRGLSSELGKSAGSCDLETTQTVLVTPNNLGRRRHPGPLRDEDNASSGGKSDVKTKAFALERGMEEDIILLAGKNIHDKRTVAWSKDQLRDWADRFKAARDDAGLDAGVAAAVREARLQMTKMDPGAFESQCRANRRRLEAWLSTQVHLAMYRSDGDKES